MNASIFSAIAEQQISIAQFSTFNLSGTRVSRGLLIRMAALLLLLLGSTGNLSARTLPLDRMQLISTQAVHEASVSLGSTVSTSSYTEFQLQITSVSGFEGCSGYAALSVDDQTLSFVLNNPSGSPLPANTDVATVQVHDPSTGEQFDYLATTDSGGVMILIPDL
jgi:hypothetical protein